MQRHPLDPREAEKKLAMRWRARRFEETPVDICLGRYLAKDVPIPPSSPPGAPPRSALNGYILMEGMGAGEYLFLHPPEDEPAPIQDRDRRRGQPPVGVPFLQRVETGDPLPPGTERIIPMERTSIVARSAGSPPRVRIPEKSLPPPGFGIVSTGESALVAEAGTRIGPRLQAFLLSREIRKVDTFPPLWIGTIAVGSDLTEAAGGLLPGSRKERDMNSLWLAASIRALGHVPYPLGIVGDDLSEGREALLEARDKKLDAVILSGGLGSGLTDRTAELIFRTGGEVSFEKVAMEPGSICLAGEVMGMKLIGLGGKPLDAAAAFDFFARPALLSALGCPASRRDWSLRPLPAGLFHGPREPAGQDPAFWSACAVESKPGNPGYMALRLKKGQIPFNPWIPGQSGWVLLPPRESPDPDLEGVVFYQGLEEEGSGPTILTPGTPTDTIVPRSK